LCINFCYLDAVDWKACKKLSSNNSSSLLHFSAVNGVTPEKIACLTKVKGSSSGNGVVVVVVAVAVVAVVAAAAAAAVEGGCGCITKQR